MADPSVPCELHELRWCGDCNTPPSGIRLLPPGPSSVVNHTGKPEVVYAPASWAVMSDRAAEAADGGLGNWRAAQFGGYCQACGGRVQEGDMIRWDDAEGGWIGDCCGAE